jgi:predicted transcriptional regulator
VKLKNTERNTHRNNQSIIDVHREMMRQCVNAGQVGMRYRRGDNNTQTGNIRLELSLKIAVRFGFTSSTLLSRIYNMKHRQAKEHLNKLVKKGLLIKVSSMRSIDGSVYAPTRNGAKMVEDLLDVPVYFRNKKAGLEVNQNAVVHDSIVQMLLLISLEESIELEDGSYYRYIGIVTEPETKRIVQHAKFRTLDGMLLGYNPSTNEYEKLGIEYENCFKHPPLRSQILISYVDLLKTKIYDKIILVSHSVDILKDAKRINDKLIVDLCNVRNKSGSTLISGQDAALLESEIVYECRYCDELTQIFYR